jgi:hypothetical protein
VKKASRPLGSSWLTFRLRVVEEVLSQEGGQPSAATSIMAIACASLTEPEEASLLILGRGSVRVRLGHHGEIRG